MLRWYKLFRIYKQQVIFNTWVFEEIWIDTHYEVKHSKSINDDLVLSLLKEISKILPVKMIEKGTFEYYDLDMEYNDKIYRLIIVIPEDKLYLGVRNAYRRTL